MIRALYIPGDTPLHRLGAAAKLAALIVVAGAVGFGGWIALAGVAALVLLGWIAAGLGVAQARQSLRPLIVFAVVIFAVQAWLVGVLAAALVVCKLLVVVLAASLISLTTKVSEMLAALERVLPEQASFAIMLAIRFLPALSQIATDVREAQRARGLERNFIAAAVPILIRTLREADAVAEALAARGWSRT